MSKFLCYYVDPKTVEVRNPSDDNIICTLRIVPNTNGAPYYQDLMAVSRILNGFTDRALMNHIYKDCQRAYIFKARYLKDSN